MRTKAWGQKETQEYYRRKFATIDIPRENAKKLLDLDSSIGNNIHTGRFRAILKQLESEDMGERE